MNFFASQLRYQYFCLTLDFTPCKQAKELCDFHKHFLTFDTTTVLHIVLKLVVYAVSIRFLFTQYYERKVLPHCTTRVQNFQYAQDHFSEVTCAQDSISWCCKIQNYRTRIVDLGGFCVANASGMLEILHWRAHFRFHVLILELDCLMLFWQKRANAYYREILGIDQRSSCCCHFRWFWNCFNVWTSFHQLSFTLGKRIRHEK